MLCACGALTPDKPQRPTLYDFGPGLRAQDATAEAARGTAIMLSDVESSTALDSAAMYYRLAYADDRQLHPYARARWSAPPAQLVRQRLRDILGRDRPVLDPSDAAAAVRAGGKPPRILRLELEEFSHVFDTPAQSFGQLRLRATLVAGPGSTDGGQLLAQRQLAVREPAPSADASGGARALGAATDAAGEQLRAWLAQQP